MHALITAILERPDIIISGHLFHGQLALAIAKLVGAKLMCQLHGVEVWGPMKRNHLRALELADQVWCVSRDTKAHVDAKSSRPQPNTVVVPNTVAPNFVPMDRAAARLKFSFGEAYCILSVGRLDSREQYKGHDRIIKEMPRLREIRPDIQYVIAGEGDDQPRLENLVRELGLGAAVTFLGKVPLPICLPYTMLPIFLPFHRPAKDLVLSFWKQWLAAPLLSGWMLAARQMPFATVNWVFV